jgi:hypothetical protein
MKKIGKKYREENKEKINNYQKKYREENREKIRESWKVNYEKFKPSINKYGKKAQFIGGII